MLIMMGGGGPVSAQPLGLWFSWLLGRWSFHSLLYTDQLWNDMEMSQLPEKLLTTSVVLFTWKFVCDHCDRAICCLTPVMLGSYDHVRWTDVQKKREDLVRLDW